MEIKEGNLVSIHQVPVKPPIINQTNLMSGTSTAAHLSGKIHLDDGMNASDIVYKFTTPNDPAAKGKSNLDRDHDVENSGKGRHDNLPQQVFQPSWADRRGSTVATAQPRLVTAPAGENNLDFSSVQVSKVTTSPTEPVKFWRPWESVSRKIHPAIPRASFKGYNVQQPTPAEELYNFSTMASMQTPYLVGANRTGYMPRLRDLLLTTVQPMLRSEIPPTSFIPHASRAPTSRFVAFTPYIVRKRGSRIQMTKQGTNPKESGPQTNIERPPPRQ